ncbi:ribonuclease H-like domain-containing protein [Tanacetum coccineum]
MKDAPFNFSEECKQAFDKLKQELTRAPIMIKPDWSLPFEIMCDASDYAVGAVLGQRKDKHFQPIHYAIKKMNEAHENYTMTKKELLAVVFAFDKYKATADKLTKVEIRDLFPKEQLMTISDKGDESWYADYANYLSSRVLPFHVSLEMRQPKSFSNVITVHQEGIMVSLQLQEKFSKPDSTGLVFSTTHEDWSELVTPTNELATFLYGTRHPKSTSRCVAGNEAAQILQQCHNGPSGGHHGIATTARKVFKVGFYWPSIFHDARRLVRACDACQRVGNISLRDETPQKLFPGKLKSRWYRPFVVSKDMENEAIELFDEDGNEFNMKEESRVTPLDEAWTEYVSEGVSIPAARPNQVPAGRLKLVSTGRPKLVSTGKQNRPPLVHDGRRNSSSVTSGWWQSTARPMAHLPTPTSSYFQTSTPFGPHVYYNQVYYDGDGWATAVKPSAGCSWKSHRNKVSRVNLHTDAGDEGIVDSGCSHSMTGNKERLDDFQPFKGGKVTFGGGEGRITGKGTIRTPKLDFENVYYVKELQQFNLFSVSQICDKKNRVLFTDTDCLVLSNDFKLPDESMVLLRQLKAEFEKIRMAVADLKSQELRRTLKRAGEALEPDTLKKQKSTEVPIPSVPDVPQPPVVSSPKSSGTRRKSLGRSRITKPKSILTELDLEADDKTFIKVVSDEDSEDEAPILWSAFAGWEVISTPLGEINALYMMDQTTKHFTTLREILHMVDRQDLLKLYGLVVKYYENHPVAGAGLVLWGDLQVLMDSQEGGTGSFVWNNQSHWQIRSWRLYTLSNVHVLETVSGEVLYMFVDVSYPLSVKLMERMLKHKLEIDKDVVGNDMTTAEQLIRFIKNQIAAAQFNKATKTANYMVLEGVLMKNKDAASSRDIQLICAEFSSIQVKTQADWMLLQSSYFNPQVSTSRYVVPTGRVVVPTGRYVVPAGKVIIIVSPGRLSLVPTGRVLSPGRVK